MKTNFSKKTSNELLLIASLGAFIYSIYGVFTSVNYTSTYIGTTMLSSIMLLLSFSLFILYRIEKKRG